MLSDVQRVLICDVGMGKVERLPSVEIKRSICQRCRQFSKIFEDIVAGAWTLNLNPAMVGTTDRQRVW